MLLAVVAYHVYEYFVTSETQLQAKRPVTSAPNLQQLTVTAYSAFDQEKWAEATDAFGKIVEANPNDIRARFRLAFALHRSGQHDRALSEFVFICRYEGPVRRYALYYIARIYAVKGNQRLALDYLSEAAAEGGGGAGAGEG